MEKQGQTCPYRADDNARNKRFEVGFARKGHARSAVATESACIPKIPHRRDKPGRKSLPHAIGSLLRWLRNLVAIETASIKSRKQRIENPTAFDSAKKSQWDFSLSHRLHFISALINPHSNIRTRVLCPAFTNRRAPPSHRRHRLYPIRQRCRPSTPACGLVHS
jgi:hypothetical protein